MIGPFLEGVAQSWLPCSWIIVLTGFVIGLGSARGRVIGAFAVTVLFASWAFISGWVNPPLWMAGAVVLGGGIAWFRRGSGPIQAAAIGAGAVWAWQPCVGRELGAVLNTAQIDPVASLPGIVAFMTGLLIVGLGLGAAIGWLLRNRTRLGPDRLASVFLAVLGLLMITGLWSSLASALARWSTELLA